MRTVFLSCRWLPSCCVLMWAVFSAYMWREKTVSSFHKSTNPIMGSYFHYLIKLNYFPKAPLWALVRTSVYRTSIYELVGGGAIGEGDTVQSIAHKKWHLQLNNFLSLFPDHRSLGALTFFFTLNYFCPFLSKLIMYPLIRFSKIFVGFL